MRVLYEDQLFIVRQSWWGPWRVVFKATGATVAPDLILQERMGIAWMKVRKAHYAVTAHRRFTEDVLMQIFAMASLDPLGEMGLMFAQSSPDTIAQVVSIEAHERLNLLAR